MSERKQTIPGLAVDADGKPVIDPTANVLQLVEAAIKRQDDLRDLGSKHTEARLDALKDIANLRAEHVIEIGKLETRRIDNLRDVQLQHVEQMAMLREIHSEKIAEAEGKRIDSIRQVDVTATATAADRASAAIETLAKQTASDRETLRTAVTASAATLATQNSETVSQLVGRITALELALSKSTGKEAVSDPMLGSMLQEIRSLRTEMTLSAGKGAGIEKAWGWIVAAAGSGGILAWIVSHYAK